MLRRQFLGARVVASGAPGVVAEALVSPWRTIREGAAATVTDTVERVVGRAPIAFDRWAEENVAAFRG